MVDVGSVLAGYRLVEALGTGPFGRTFRAEDARGGSATLKLLKPTFLARVDGASAFERLRASIAVHAQIAHPYLARVRGPVHEPSQQAFGQVAEHLDGLPLSDVSVGAEVRQGRDPQGLANLIQCFEQLGDVLHWLHGQGMVHGNLKPSNVLVLPHQGEHHVKLLDLSWSAIGVAAVARGPRSFVSPEQYQGSVPTPASDQWALGTMLERVFTEGQRRLSLGVLPAALVQTIQRATADAPPQRFESVEALVGQLRQIRIDLLQSAGRPVSAPHAAATLPAGSVPPDLAEPVVPSVSAPEIGPSTAEAAPMRRADLDARGAFDGPLSGPAGDPLARSELPRGGAHAHAESAPAELGAALGSAAGMVAPNALSDQVTKKADLPPQPPGPAVAVEIPVGPSTQRSGPPVEAPPTPAPRRSSSGPELYTRRRLRDSSELEPVAGPVSRGTVGVDRPDAQSELGDEDDRAAAPLRRHDVGDVLGEGMADELLDAPSHDMPFDAFEGPTTGGARRPPIPRGDTVRGPAVSVADPVRPLASYDPNQGALRVAAGGHLAEGSGDLGANPLPTPELASSVTPSPVPGVLPAAEVAAPIPPAPSPRWGPRVAAAVVVASAVGFAGWQIRDTLVAAPLVQAAVGGGAATSTAASSGAGGLGRGVSEQGVALHAAGATAAASGAEPLGAPSSGRVAAAAPSPESATPTPKAAASGRGEAASGGAERAARSSAERSRAKRAPRAGARGAERPRSRASTAGGRASRRPAARARRRPEPTTPPVLARPRATDAPPLSPDPTPPVPADAIEALDAKAGAALARLAARSGAPGQGDVEASCAVGSAPACLELARAHQQSGAREAALRSFERACELGAGAGCLRAAGGYARRPGGREKSTQLYEAACDAEVAEGCHRAAARLEGERAEALKARACRLGRAASCSDAPAD